METILLCCPKCEIPISVKVEDCQNQTEFPCPICQKTICFKFDEEELRKIVERAEREQEKLLKRAFRLSFGDV